MAHNKNSMHRRTFLKLSGFGLRVVQVIGDVELEITGRRLRLAAPTQEALGKALAIVMSDGVILETFRTPPGRLEHLLRHTPTESITTPVDAA